MSQRSVFEDVFGETVSGYRPADKQEILQAIAALASAITSRNSQLSAISDQIRQGFEHQEADIERINGAIQESTLHRIIGLEERFTKRFAAIENKLSELFTLYDATNDSIREKLAIKQEQRCQFYFPSGNQCQAVGKHEAHIWEDKRQAKQSKSVWRGKKR